MIGTLRAVKVLYHIAFLIEAGLVNGKTISEIGTAVRDFMTDQLTWKGHKFLDGLRSDTVWQKTKRTFTEQVISMTSDLVKAVS